MVELNVAGIFTREKTRAINLVVGGVIVFGLLRGLAKSSGAPLLGRLLVRPLSCAGGFPRAWLRVRIDGLRLCSPILCVSWLAPCVVYFVLQYDFFQACNCAACHGRQFA